MAGIKVALRELTRVVAEQERDEGLHFEARYASEAYLQEGWRVLTEAAKAVLAALRVRA